MNEKYVKIKSWEKICGMFSARELDQFSVKIGGYFYSHSGLKSICGARVRVMQEYNNKDYICAVPNMGSWVIARDLIEKRTLKLYIE